MISNRPYLLRAFYEWITDSDFTPILVIDATNPHCKVPQEYVEDGEIVFNISTSAIRDLNISNEIVSFKASFSGVIHLVSAPVPAILAIYAEENGEGIFLDAEDDSTGTGTMKPAQQPVILQSIEGMVPRSSSSDSSEDSDDDVTPPTKKTSKVKPFLRLIE